LLRSLRGLWVRAELKDDGIHVFWQPRYEIENGILRVLDANGDVEKTMSVAESRYGDPYRLAGIVPLTDEMVKFCGLKLFDKFAHAVMRHVVRLVVGGWGESPEEVIGLFDNWEEYQYLNGEYEFVDDVEPFTDLTGVKVTIDEEKLAHIRVKDKVFDFELDNSEIVTAFMLSTEPVV
jgi:hypothetical protein